MLHFDEDEQSLDHFLVNNQKLILNDKFQVPMLISIHCLNFILKLQS